MTEQKAEKKQSGTGKRARKWLWYTGFLFALVLIVVGFLWLSERWKLRSIEGRIAAIEAARAIPEEENAAVIYNELLETVDLRSGRPDFIALTDPAAISGPWLSEDHPETAAWLKGHESTILRLKEAVAKRECRLPIGLDPAILNCHSNLANRMHQWTYLLVAAGNNDIAEGRIDAGLDKYVSVLQMAEHIGQQPMVIDLLVSIALEAVALKNVSSFIVEVDCTKRRLDTIEEALPPTSDDWLKKSSEAVEVEMLLGKKQVNILAWWILRLQGLQRAALGRCEELCQRVLASRRGAYILLALRRYKNEHARWPESLDDIKDTVPADGLIDPINDGAFVYKLSDGGFRLYSKGRNNVDEGGEFKDDVADWPIWPPESRKTKEENANAE